MKGHKAYSEIFKNILIAVLLVSAVFLGWQSQLFGNTSVKLSDLTGFGDSIAAVPGTGGVQDAAMKAIGEARPVAIAVTTGDGHYGVKYDMEELGRVYDETAAMFGEALRTAQAPVKTDAADWRAALQAPGILLEYMSAMPLSVLDGWFGADITGEWRGTDVRRICLAVTSDKTRLLLQDGEGLFYTADTTITPDSARKQVDMYKSNDASFAFEAIGTQTLREPYALVLAADTAHPVIEARNPLTGETLTAVLRQLNVGEHLKPIQDDDGNLIYIDPEDFRISLSPDGTVTYKRTGSPETTTNITDLSQAVELAREAVAGSIGQHCGTAGVYLDSVISDSLNGYRVTFTYVVAGGRVYVSPEGYAAEVVIKDGAISTMVLRFRMYADSGEPGRLMPEIQAAAAEGGAFTLCYSDSGSDILEPFWVVPSNT